MSWSHDYWVDELEAEQLAERERKKKSNAARTFLVRDNSPASAKKVRVDSHAQLKGAA